MYAFVKLFIISCLRALISLRYKVKVIGFNKISQGKEKGGYLFLPNHPAFVVDPLITSCLILKKFSLRPVVIDYVYYTPLFHALLKANYAIPMPNFGVTSNSHKMRRMDNALNEIVEGLEKGENFLFYPAGKVKLTASEQIGGASGLHKILNEATHYNVVLVRITGLWGSSFSRANPNKPPDMQKAILEGVKHTLKNLLFFNPRREVTVEFVKAPDDFPFQEGKSIQNKWLECWYNQTDLYQSNVGQEEPLNVVPYSMWNRKLPEFHAKKESKEEVVDLEKVPSQTRHLVFEKLAEMCDISSKHIQPEMNLMHDLGIDSLEAAELGLFLEENFDVEDVPSDQLTTVGKILAVASKQVRLEKPTEAIPNLAHWKAKHKNERLLFPTGTNILELFLKICEKMGSSVACADHTTGVLTYTQLQFRSILLSRFIEKLPGEYIGIMLPSSVGATVCIFATLMAGKIPVMINWTLGSRHIDAVIKTTNLQACLSSWKFLDRLPHVNLGQLVDILYLLEDVREKITLKDKLFGFLQSKRGSDTLIKQFGVSDTPSTSAAVVLFTSGSEGNPKGVPLSHKNILSNLRSVNQVVNFYQNDTLFSILPPFHSFGFTIGIMAPLLTGVRVAFHPNPTEGAKIAKGIAQWKATLICGAPSFLKNILKHGTKDHFKTLRLTVTGAEKAPEDLFRLVEKLGIGDTLIEGYGITECSPVVTINRKNEKPVGVGKPIPHVEVCVINPDTYEKLSPNQQGMILVSGPNVFSGYINVTTNPFVSREGKTWYITGDLGFLDEQNHLVITGRLKRFIKVGPEMISLASIEMALMEKSIEEGWPHSEAGPILAICAKEVPGEKPRIFLFTTFPLSVEKANKILKDVGFSNLIRINKVDQVEAIPLMGTGKVHYRQLEDKYLSKSD